MENAKIEKYIAFIELYMSLKNIEKDIIRLTLNDKHYNEMSNGNYVSESSLRDTGSELFKKLTNLFKRPINKREFSQEIERIYSEYERAAPIVYIKRESIEEGACSATIQPGSLVRIKAPHKMGKTLLLGHILNDVEEREGFQIVICDFGLFECFIYDSYIRFLKAFCSTVIKKLKFDADNTNELLKIIDSTVESNNTITEFFEDHILPKLSGTGHLVLALEDFNNILERDNISENFCKLLRYIRDHAKRDSKSIWNKMHLIIIHSTDVYGRTDINSSPLAGVGEFFQFDMFDDNQRTELFELYNLDSDDSLKQQIIELLNGHPYLLTLAIKEIKKQKIAIEASQEPERQESCMEFAVDEFLRTAPTESSIFSDHLRQLLNILNQDSDLKEAYNQVVSSNTDILLLDSRPLSFKLYSLGLIKRDGNEVSPSCNLYKIYFENFLNLN